MGHQQADTIDIEDKFGNRVRISGPGQGQQGYFMAPRSTGLLDDAPVKTIWQKSMFGQSYSGMEWERREAIWTVNIGYDNDNLVDPDRDPDEWHDLYDDWRNMFAYDRDTKIIYGTGTDERILYARMIERPKPFSTHAFEGKDPKLWSFGAVVMTMACEFPFYVGPEESYVWEFEGSGTAWTRLPFFNPSDVPVFPWYEVSPGAKWHIPDFSWGNEMYGRGLGDLDKIITTPKITNLDGHTDIYTRPDTETYQSENDTPVGLRSDGRDFEYPIPPGEGVGDDDPDNGAAFTATDVDDGGILIAHFPRWYSSPYSRPRLFRVA